ncbi:hypothetical protein V2J09_022996 [Rumex salicifolius]
MAGAEKTGRSMEETATWAISLVCFLLVFLSIFIEQVIHHIGSWLSRRHKVALYEALEKIKSELMFMGFISLLLTGLQKPISKICISHAGKSPLMSIGAIHELHIFIFILAVFHVLYCITTLALGRLKMRRWMPWENETRSVEYQSMTDQERFTFTRDTSFGRRHLNFWSRTTILLWIVCFFRQFYGSVTKVDYLTLRRGFIIAHLAPESDTRFDFRKYISRSLEEDFTVLVGISPIMWFFAVLFLLGFTHGWYSYYWLPFLPLIIILLVGTKLQLIITNLGLKIQESGNVVKGDPVVHPDDSLFWFSRPRFLLFLIHFVLFQNAFQLAFFAFSWSKYGSNSCFHHRVEDAVIRISMGIIIHILCSYVTLPLYALVTQMGSKMKPTVFSERVAKAVMEWHHSTRVHGKSSKTHGHNSDNNNAHDSDGKKITRPISPDHLLRTQSTSNINLHPSDSKFWNTNNALQDDDSNEDEHDIVLEIDHHHQMEDGTIKKQKLSSISSSSH